MCWLRSWSQILLPVFISLFLIQLFISFSENSFSQISRYKDKQRTKTMNDECTAADNCQSCINRKKCFWCSKEKACKKICFPNSECPVSCSFWLNCQVDMFGFLMLLLLVIMVIAFICQFCIYQYYLQSNFFKRSSQKFVCLFQEEPIDKLERSIDKAKAH